MHSNCYWAEIGLQSSLPRLSTIAPPSKYCAIGQWASVVSTNPWFTIVELRKEEARDAAVFVVQLDNIPVILAPDQVQEKLE